MRHRGKSAHIAGCQLIQSHGRCDPVEGRRDHASAFDAVPEGAAQQFGKKVLLAVEVVVERGLTHPGKLRDLAGGRSGVALADERLCGRVEELLLWVRRTRSWQPAWTAGARSRRDVCQRTIAYFFQWWAYAWDADFANPGTVRLPTPAVKTSQWVSFKPMTQPTSPTTSRTRTTLIESVDHTIE